MVLIEGTRVEFWISCKQVMKAGTSQDDLVIDIYTVHLIKKLIFCVVPLSIITAVGMVENCNFYVVQP